MRIQAAIQAAVLAAWAGVANSLAVPKGSSCATTTRRDFFANAALAGAALASSTPALAAAGGSFEGVYTDSSKPNGWKVIRKTSERLDAAVVELQDSPEKAVFQFPAKWQYNAKRAQTAITIKELKDNAGQYADGRVVFPDETWTKAEGVEGVYLDPQHKAGFRVVRLAPAGGKGKNKTPAGLTVKLQDDPGAEVLTISATTAKPKETDAPGSTTYNVDFTAKGGPKAVPAVFQGDKLSFPDGNAWQKL